MSAEAAVADSPGAVPTSGPEVRTRPVAPGGEAAYRYSPFPDVDSSLVYVAELTETENDPDLLAAWLTDLWETKAALAILCDETEGRLVRLMAGKRKLDTDHWHLETKTGSAKVTWDHELARGRIYEAARETGENPLDLLYRVASVAYYRQGALVAEGINADGLKSSEPGRTRVVIVPREDTG